jgi:hypothetical protein
MAEFIASLHCLGQIDGGQITNAQILRSTYLSTSQSLRTITGHSDPSLCRDLYREWHQIYIRTSYRPNTSQETPAPSVQVGPSRQYDLSTYQTDGTDRFDIEVTPRHVSSQRDILHPVNRTTLSNDPWSTPSHQLSTLERQSNSIEHYVTSRF